MKHHLEGGLQWFHLNPHLLGLHVQTGPPSPSPSTTLPQPVCAHSSPSMAGVEERKCWSFDPGKAGWGM
jgi:hypothetical protein